MFSSCSIAVCFSIVLADLFVDSASCFAESLGFCNVEKNVVTTSIPNNLKLDI